MLISSLDLIKITRHDNKPQSKANLEYVDSLNSPLASPVVGVKKTTNPKSKIKGAIIAENITR
tara:strand:+ start:956 stop:1144 length:189 start_codon:yes stop_codon:yes gene_type:complete